MTTTTTDSYAERWGANLRAARLKAGLTQVQLAKLARVTQYTVSRIENGGHRPSDESKILLARAFGVTVEALFPYPHPTEGWAS